MGLLTEDILEQDFITCGTLFKVESIETTHTDALGGHGFGLVLMLIGNPHMQELKEMVANLPLVSDEKHRLRLDNDALLKFAIGCFKWNVQNEIRKANPVVSISSTKDHVYYVLTSDYQFEDGWSDNRIMRISLKKL